VLRLDLGCGTARRAWRASRAVPAALCVRCHAGQHYRRTPRRGAVADHPRSAHMRLHEGAQDSTQERAEVYPSAQRSTHRWSMWSR